MTTKDTPRHEVCLRVADDIYRVRVPLPFALNHVNCYLVRGSTGWTILDTGINTAAGQAAWRQSFAQLGIAPRQIEKIIVSHLHPDHFGMVGWLQSLAQAEGHTVPVYMSEIEIGLFGRIWESTDTEKFTRFLRYGGVTDDIIHAVTVSHQETMAMTYPRPPQFIPIRVGEWLSIGERPVQAIRTQGHSDGHFMFYHADEALLFSGDHVLLTITPNIGLWIESEPDPLGRYLQSLADLASLPVQQALPGHRAFITDWRGRLGELRAHHDHRLSRTLDAVADGNTTAYQVAQFIFDSTSRFTVHEWRFAVAETLAHLDYLRLRDQLSRTDEGGVWHYRLM